MAFTSRFVCKSVGDIASIEEIRYKINEREVVWSEEREGLKLESWIYLYEDLIVHGKEKFLEGTVFHQHLFMIPDYERKGRNLEEKTQTIRKTSKVKFWLSSNPGIVLFSSAKNGEFFGRKVLSDAIFGEEDKILPVTFDIRKIEEDYRNTLWTHSFRDRNGNIKKGQHYGDQIANDPMYGQTAGAPKNFVGVLSSVTNSPLKVRINRNGVITIFSDLNEPNELQTVFNIVDEFLPYSILQRRIRNF